MWLSIAKLLSIIHLTSAFCCCSRINSLSFMIYPLKILCTNMHWRLRLATSSLPLHLFVCLPFCDRLNFFIFCFKFMIHSNKKTPVKVLWFDYLFFRHTLLNELYRWSSLNTSKNNLKSALSNSFQASTNVVGSFFIINSPIKVCL